MAFEGIMLDNSDLRLEMVNLTPQDFDRAAVLLAKAFYDNPSHQYIFTEPKTRLKLLHWGLKANLKLNLASSTARANSFALADDKPPGTRNIKAMGFWHPPEGVAIDFFTKLKSGWLLAPFVFGRENYQRLCEVLTAMEEIKQQVLGTDKAWYLNNMAVAKELRRQGIGKTILHQQLKSKVISSDCPAILMTQKQINVEFYQKVGFKIAAQSIVGTNKNAFINWCMLFG